MSSLRYRWTFELPFSRLPYNRWRLLVIPKAPRQRRILQILTTQSETSRRNPETPNTLPQTGIGRADFRGLWRPPAQHINTRGKVQAKGCTRGGYVEGNVKMFIDGGQNTIVHTILYRAQENVACAASKPIADDLVLHVIMRRRAPCDVPRVAQRNTEVFPSSGGLGLVRRTSYKP